MRLKSLIAVVIILLTLACGSLSEAGLKLRIATETAYPPFTFIDIQGRPAGFDVDIAHALCRAMEAECTLMPVPWEGIIEGLQAGKYDLIIASMSYTPERATRVEFTEKYYQTTSSYIAKRGSGNDNRPENIKGQIVATQKETVHADYLMSTYGPTIILKLTDTLEQSFDLLAADQAQLVLCDTLAGLGFLRSPAGANFGYLGQPLTEKNLAGTTNIAVRKGDIKLRDAINQALKKIRLDGEYDRINKKYFPFSIY